MTQAWIRLVRTMMRLRSQRSTNTPATEPSSTIGKYAAVKRAAVASVELVCGALIVVGLATRPAALMLCGVMVVAIVTAAAPEHHITASWHGLLEFLYLPEVLLLMVLAWFVFAGPGRASLDARFGTRG